MKEKLKLTKGITLIALVITIVVLLVMAGFSISVMVGDNSVIDQAKNSKEQMEIAQWEEKINQAIIEAEGGNRDVTLDDVIGELIDKGVIENPDDVDRYTGTVTTKEPEHIIEGLLDDYVDAPPSLAENVKFTITPNTPTNKPIELKIETGIEGFTLQYSLDDGENWEDYDEAKGITLEHNDVVFARLWSGLKESEYATAESEYATANVENIDRLPPNSFSVTVSEVGINEITVTGGTVDAEKTDEDACSGINGYYFSNDGGVTWEPSVPQKDPNYTFEGLEPDTNYDIVIKAEDNAGNEVETVKKPQKTEPDKLDPPTMTFKSKTTSSITVDAVVQDKAGSAVVQDKAGRDITYTLYVSTNKNGPYTAKASTTKVAGTKVTLTASGLNMYTNYYYYVGIQSGKVTAETTSKGNVRTYCSGRTNVCTPKYCSGGRTSSYQATCSSCSGAGTKACTGSFKVSTSSTVCPECGKTATASNGTCSKCGAMSYRMYCSSCGKGTGYSVPHLNIKCTSCGGDGKVTRYSYYNCSHGYSGSHYYCQHSNNRSSATHYYCAHSSAGVQHD